MNITKTPDYSRTIEINSTAPVVYEALTLKIDQWWGQTEGSFLKTGDIFKTSFGKDSYWKFEIAELIENEKIVWMCIESHQDHHLKGMDEEWLGSSISWELLSNENQTIVQFRHKGLIPSNICYDVCSKAWGFYLDKSLKTFIETGVGKPEAG